MAKKGGMKVKKQKEEKKMDWSDLRWFCRKCKKGFKTVRHKHFRSEKK
jgi:hypothetical protein